MNSRRPHVTQRAPANTLFSLLARSLLRLASRTANPKESTNADQQPQRVFRELQPRHGDHDLPRYSCGPTLHLWAAHRSHGKPGRTNGLGPTWECAEPRL